MRLLLVHNFYREEGGENAVFRLLRAILEEHGHEVEAYVRDSAETDGVTPLQAGRLLAEGLHSRRTTHEVRALVQRRPPDAALVQNVFPLISPSVYGTLAGAGVPTAQLVFNYRFVCPDAQLFTEGQVCERCVQGSFVNAVVHRCYRDDRLASAWYAAILGLHRARGTFTRIDRLLLPDEFMRGVLTRGGFDPARMDVVGTPFDPAPYGPGDREADEILFVGRLVRQKGILTLLRAFAAAPVTARLLVVGEGACRSEAEALAARLCPGRVDFRGAVWGEPLLDLLRRCRFLCVPSEWYDNAPLVVHQAMACGRPVLASRIDGLPEIVREGETGLLAAPGDVEDWTRSIISLAGDEVGRARLGRIARATALADFSRRAYHDRLMAALAQVAAPTSA